MTPFSRPLLAAPCAAICAAAMCASAAPASAAGDLLVAPTRIVLDGARGTEVILNNIGTETATYRISLELRRMDGQGALGDVAAASAAQQAALAMIAFAPRRVTLSPGQPQAIRIGVRAPAGLPDGEYRAHMLFRAIPDARPAIASAATKGGITIDLKPVYGVTIPIIVRRGRLEATAAIANARLLTQGTRQAVSFDLIRTGSRSVYGEVLVFKPGVAAPVVLNRGIAVYTEVGTRNVTLPVVADHPGSIAGPVRIQYVEWGPEGPGRTLAEARVVLR